MAVNVEIGRIVEDGAEVGSRNYFGARTEQSLQGEPIKGKRRQNVFVGLVIGIAGNTVVVRRIIEFRKKQRLALTVIEGAGKENAEAVELMAIRGPAFIGAETSGLKRKFPIL